MNCVQIIDHVIHRLIQQGCKSVLASGIACCYTSPTNPDIHCGIGWLQPGAPFYEGREASSDENLALLVERGVISEAQARNGDFLVFLDDLQDAHDSASNHHFIEEFKENCYELRFIAKTIDRKLMMEYDASFAV